MIASETVVPRSGWRMISRVTTRVAGTNGIIISRVLERSARRDASRCAPHTAMAILASSEGCSDTPATTNHPRVPCDSVPMPGMSTRTSSTTVTANAGNENRRSTRTGTIRAR